jgi:hypothetical protein
MRDWQLKSKQLIAGPYRTEKQNGQQPIKITGHY